MIKFACGKHFSQKSSHQRESGHSTLAECVVWSCWPWSELRGVLVFNIPLVFCPWPYWGHSSPLLQRGRLKLTYSLTAADLLSFATVCPFYLFVQPSIDLPNGRSLLFPQVSVSISIPAETSRCFVHEFDSEMLKEVDQAALVWFWWESRALLALNINRSVDTC